MVLLCCRNREMGTLPNYADRAVGASGREPTNSQKAESNQGLGKE
jgi:hypothetical protein